MSKKLSAREIHAQSEQARETDKLDLALILIDKAILQYQQEKDQAGQAEALCSKFLALKHKYRETKDLDYLNQAKEEVEEAVAIAEKLSDKSGLIIPLINLAKVLEELDRSAESIQHYQKAAQINQETKLANHDQDLLAEDIALHLALVELETGDKTALARVENVLEKLNTENKVRDSFRVNTLISGAYLKLYKYFKNTNLSKAEKYLKLAKKLINQDERLVLRKKQLAELVLE